MTTPNYYPGNLQWLGLAKQTSVGVAAAAPTVWVPVLEPKHTPKQTVIVDDAMRGTMVAEHSQFLGMEYAELEYKSYWYLGSLYHQLYAALGNPDTISGASDPYTHKTSVYNGTGSGSAQPAQYTLWLFEGDKCAQFIDAKVATAKLTAKANEKPELEMHWMSMPETWVTPPTNTPDVSKPFPSSNIGITYNGAALPAGSDISVEIKRETKPIPVLNGTVNPLDIFTGEVTVSGQITSVFQGSTDPQLTAMLAGTLAPLVLTGHPGGDSVHTLTVQMSVVGFTTAVPQPSKSEWITIQSDYHAYGNATDALDAKESNIQVIQLTADNLAY